MLSIPRLRNVLKKLETSSDLAKFLIQRATAVAGTITKDYVSPLDNPPNVTSSGGSMDVSSLSKTLPPPSNTTTTTTTTTPTTATNTFTKTSSNLISESIYTIEQHEKQQPKTITAAIASVSLFSGVESNSGVVVRAASNDSSNIRERTVDGCGSNSHSENHHHQTSTATNNNKYDMSDAKVKEMTQLDENKSICNGASCDSESDEQHNGCITEKSCFNSSRADILRFMELVGNLKHTKRTGWVLRDVNDCESISGHMYRMSIMTFLLDGSEGLNQIRCMELALVHDLAESLVGDLTPFCGVAKEDKKQMELKAMQDICKLIEPRGKRIMELFEEYEEGQSAESKFVKDLDRLDMVMQAFEYEKRDNCLMKHQEFFDSTEGKFQHPFIQKLVKEIYDQRKALAELKAVANGNLKLKTVTPNCPPCLEHKNERS